MYAYNTIIEEFVLWHKKFGILINYVVPKDLHHKGLAKILFVISDEKNVCQVFQFRKNKLPFHARMG